MPETIADIATDPRQYDRDELIWASEGSKGNWNRKLYLEFLQPTLKTVDNLNVLDIGCGQGWLCEEIAQHGGKPLGLDPSAKNIKLARATYPELSFVELSLQDFERTKQFDVSLAIMVLEHFQDIDKTFAQVAETLKPEGQFVTIVGDFTKFTTSDRHPLEKEVINHDEIAIRVDYGLRAGVMCDIMRTHERHIAAAKQAGLTLAKHTPITPPPGHPRYEAFKDRPIFHLLEFTKESVISAAELGQASA